MATRSTITAKLSDGTYKSVYCHFDGYPDNNGAMLLQHYTSQESIEALLDLGAMSSLGETPEKTVFYGRDRGEEDAGAVTGPTLAAVMDGRGERYNYLWDGTRWMVDGKPLTRAMCKLPVKKTGNAVVDALQAAEDFIVGFEDDDAQEGIPELLAQIRAAIETARA